jgi:hypothetical protein
MWLCRTIPDMRVHIPPRCGADQRRKPGISGTWKRKIESRIVTVCCIANRTGHCRKNVRVIHPGHGFIAIISGVVSLERFLIRAPILSPFVGRVLAEPCSKCSFGFLLSSFPPFGDEGDRYSIFHNISTRARYALRIDKCRYRHEWQYHVHNN